VLFVLLAINVLEAITRANVSAALNIMTTTATVAMVAMAAMAAANAQQTGTIFSYATKSPRKIRGLFLFA